MTRAIARYGQGWCSLVSVGHAGTAESCAAVSALVQALAGWVRNNGGGVLRLGAGRAELVFPRVAGADAVMDMAVIGLLQVAKAAPADVAVEIVDDR